MFPTPRPFLPFLPFLPPVLEQWPKNASWPGPNSRGVLQVDSFYPSIHSCTFSTLRGFFQKIHGISAQKYFCSKLPPMPSDSLRFPFPPYFGCSTSFCKPLTHHLIVGPFSCAPKSSINRCKKPSILVSALDFGRVSVLYPIGRQMFFFFFCIRFPKQQSFFLEITLCAFVFC